jgi:hypothetical protein
MMGFSFRTIPRWTTHPMSTIAKEIMSTDGSITP